MTFIILPLLVLSQFNLNNELWQHGPEVIYNVAYQAHITPRIPDDSRYVPDIVSVAQLKCRPRSMSILNCNLTTDYTRLKASNHSRNSPPIPMFGDGIHFEIRFNRLGIKDLVVSSSTSPQFLDLLRFVVNHLHVGIDLTNKTEGEYEQWEHYTTGNCFTRYQIQFNNTIDNDGENKPNELNKIWNPRMRTVIVKQRDVHKCQPSAPYYLSSRENWRDDPHFGVSMKASVSHVTVDESTFISTTETYVTLKGLKGADDVTMHEYMMVIFDSIVPAEGEIRKIDDPSSAGIITGRWLHDEYSDDSNEDLEPMWIH